MKKIIIGLLIIALLVSFYMWSNYLMLEIKKIQYLLIYVINELETLKQGVII